MINRRLLVPLYLVALFICSGCVVNQTSENSISPEPASVPEWNYRKITGVDGVPISTVSIGNPDNPALIFVHGIGQSHYSFFKQLDASLANDYFLIAFDLRGHGSSGKPWVEGSYSDSAIWAGDLEAVFNAYEVDRAVIVAWSFGTNVVMDYLRNYGDLRIAGINLTGGLGAIVPWRFTKEDSNFLNEFKQLKKLQLSSNPADNLVAAEQAVAWLTEQSLEEPVRQKFMAASMMLPSYARSLIGQRRHDNADLVSQLAKLPVLMSLGQKDNPAMLEDARDIVAANELFALSVYELAGHSVFIERPERFNEELKQFANKVYADVARAPLKSVR